MATKLDAHYKQKAEEYLSFLVNEYEETDSKFEKLKKDLPQLIEKTGLSKRSIAKQLKLNPVTFNRQLEDKQLSIEDVKTILSIISNPVILQKIKSKRMKL